MVRRIETEIPDLVLLEATAHGDQRGFLVETFRENESWWGPIRSGEYQAYYEKQYGRKLSA